MCIVLALAPVSLANLVVSLCPEIENEAVLCCRHCSATSSEETVAKTKPAKPRPSRSDIVEGAGRASLRKETGLIESLANLRNAVKDRRLGRSRGCLVSR